MIISANGGGKEFKPCPEYSGRAVCVDVSPLKEYETEYGMKKKFKFAFELDLVDGSRDPVQPWVVLSKPLVPSLHEKAALTKVLKDWFGRKLTDQENNGLDLESLIGKPVTLIIAHEQSQDGTKTYANIKLMMPHKHGEALQPSGLWKRFKDRPTKDDKVTAIIPDGTTTLPLDLGATKVHVGKFKGTAISELTDAAVKGLGEHWLPKAQTSAGKTTDDIQLIAALTKRLQEIDAKDQPDFDDVPF